MQDYENFLSWPSIEINDIGAVNIKRRNDSRASAAATVEQISFGEGRQVAAAISSMDRLGLRLQVFHLVLSYRKITVD